MAGVVVAGAGVGAAPMITAVVAGLALGAADVLAGLVGAAAEVTGLSLEFHEMSVYDIARLHQRFDLVLFMGVLYHLRYPLLALDLIRTHVVADTLVCQSLQRGSANVADVAEDYPFDETALFEEPAAPRMQFIEHDALQR